MPTVSLICACYNAAPYLTEMIASVQAQDFTDWELLIWDNGSIDGSTEIIGAARNKDLRIKMFRSDGNWGPGRARNELLRNAAGDFVMNMDADDISLPTRISKVLAKFKANPHLVAVGHDIEQFGPPGTPKDHITKVTYGNFTVTRALMEQYNPVLLMTMTYRRRELLAANCWWDEIVWTGEDTLLVSRVVAAYPYRIDNIREKLLKYRRHAGQLTSSEGRNEMPRLAVTAAPGVTRAAWLYAIWAGVAKQTLRQDPVAWKWMLARCTQPQFSDAVGITAEERGTVTVVGQPASPGKVVYFGWDYQFLQEFAQRWIKEQNRPYEFIDHKADFHAVAAAMKGASFVLIWSGSQHNGRNAAEMCRSMGIPVVFFEQGMAPQSTTYFMDPMGFNQDSVLMKRDLSWITNEDIQTYRQGTDELRAKWPRKPIPGRILVTLQIESDTQILYHSMYRTMDEFIQHVETIYPASDLVFRPHPKSPRQDPKVGPRSKVETEGSLYEAAVKSELVVGINSTALIEAAILGVPVLALGECPLRITPLRHRERLLAGYWALRVPRDASPAAVLTRFGLRPLD